MEGDVQKPGLHLAVQSKTGERPAGLDPDGRISVISGLSVGRGEDNDLVLPDPRRVISKHHCVISQIETGLVLVDHSRNGTFLNREAERLQQDTPVPLAEGDVIRIGDFSLTVLQDNEEEQEVSDKIPEPSAEQTFLGAVPMKQPELGFAPTSEKSLETEDAADLFADHQRGLFARPDLPAVADHLDSGRGAFVQPGTSSGPIPDDWNLMDELGQGHDVSSDMANGAFSEPLSHEAAVDPSDRRDVWAWPTEDDAGLENEGLRNGSSRKAEARPTKAGDWDANEIPVLPSQTPSGVTDAAAEKAFSAFLLSAGLDKADIPQGQHVEMMALAGAMLRETVTVLHRLLQAQSRLQNGIGGTAGSQNTNPLMLFGTPEEALHILLRPDLPGFMSGEAAAQQAGSQIGTFQEDLSTIMQDALQKALHDLSPGAISPATKGPNVFSNGYRRLWDAYDRTHTRIRGELEAELQKRFGSGAALRLANPGKTDDRYDG
ncbi:type VI secretion system-associated FHA domain protein TagH [Thalassococcus sp. S3]|uniref:type VI secretion system-associated FHA domain protein TagH n=1 Tax=Thalassococcus sp. S3 TaxID=2017482 RepID=UPI0010247A34|nr:type VI secretion system-associated FHA domain protein TagH [Thalassococcus sp. S3]QBF33980.1 hypothetical protein CFI11_22630 [Thalassococcus sp. S3]